MDWNTWTRREEWPPKPDGYTWLMSAAEQIARTAIGDDWVGNEFAFESLHLALAPSDPKSGNLEPQQFSAVWFWAVGPRPFLNLDQPTQQHWIEAFNRWRWCFENQDEILKRKILASILIQIAAERGDLQFHARNETTGDMVPIPRARWNCDTNIAMARISRGRINLVQPMALEPLDLKGRQRWLDRMTSWLFVAEENLVTFLASLSKDHTFDSGASDEDGEVGGGLVVSTGKALKECGVWLREEFDKADTSHLRKDEFKQMAIEERFVGRLSGRGFRDVWDKVAKDYPSRTIPGPKPK